MELHLTKVDGTQTLAVQGATAGSVIQLRFQNTMNGTTKVVTLEADAHGAATVFNPPPNFGVNFAITAYINGALIPFTVAPNSTAELLRFVEPEKPVATTVPPAH